MRSVAWSATLIRRYLEHRGYEVTFVHNFTDVDDKIIARARRGGRRLPGGRRERNIDAYFAVRATRSASRRPPHYPRATEHIPEILALIERLIAARATPTPAGGDVYFDVRRSRPTTASSPAATSTSCAPGARVEVDERQARPARLRAVEGRPSPASRRGRAPGGRGGRAGTSSARPCRMKYLGETFDIHGGGVDLIFPHHENEIAQSEAATGKPFVRLLDAQRHGQPRRREDVEVDEHFFLIEDMLRTVPPEAIRFYLLSTHYRSPIEFSEERLAEAQTAFERLRQPVERFGGFVEGPAEPPADPALVAARDGFHEAMQDDFNTARAMGHLFDLARAVNRLGEAGDAPGARAGARLLRELGAARAAPAGPAGAGVAGGGPAVGGRAGGGPQA